MNNTQLYLSIGIPTFAVLLAWLTNRSDIHRLNDKVDKLAETLRAELLGLRKDFNGEFTDFRKQVNSEFVAFRSESNSQMVGFRREIHEDLLLLHERVVKVEARQES